MKNYDHKIIEKKWQEEWDKNKIYKVADEVKGKENFYQLVEFTYPSGNLHVGHWYAFSVPDIFARYKRMSGYNVLYPMGFDAFGLPAENAAIKLGADPKIWTYEHMDKMRLQLRSMGASFDWEREVVTCDPKYYKWTQWMFNQFLKNDLAYRDTTKVNWCPKDMTILANEQVTDGKCERCGNEVEQRDQEQWMLRISKYADRLIDDLDALDWPLEIKSAQKNWIGRSEGSEIEFEVHPHPASPLAKGEVPKAEGVRVFTTRADTLFGVSYIAIAPEHELILKLKDKIENYDEVEKYISDTKKKSELDRQQSKEKTGVELKGIKAINPATGEWLSVWTADYVLAGYGTGAVMGVPQHDERDNAFAVKYNLPIIDKPLVDAKEVTEKVGGKLVSTYRLRDWGISRQRYWGVPIPIVYDTEGKAHPVPDEHLPWLLPTDVDHKPSGVAPLSKSKELLERTEKIFGKGWRPEVETMDTFVDSSWYFYRYLDNNNDKEFSAKEKMESWMPVDLYMGGAEHTTMHLLYSRFWVKALFDLGLVKDAEAYKVRKNRGLILGPDGNKMSKSKGNVIDPDEIVDRLGADTVRLYLAFMGPYGVTVNYPWDPNGVVGVRRFLERVWKLAERITAKPAKDFGAFALGDIGQGTHDSKNSLLASQSKLLHKTIKSISEDMEEHKYNTCISKMMILLNSFDKEEKVSTEDFKTFLCLLAPFAPHIAEELWTELGEKESIHLSLWPKYDENLIKDDEIKIAVQVNGKVRGEITISVDENEEEIKNKGLADENVARHLASKEIKKVIYVKGRLISIVV